MNDSRCWLSIIVPVYNTEKYLADCLNSLLKQNISKNQYEIICVDDGSTDSSPTILDEYAEKHSNIRVMHKENGGVSSARNTGIDHARGEYVWFVDSDDVIKPNCLGYIWELCKKRNPEVMQFGWSAISEEHPYAALPPDEISNDSAKVGTIIMNSTEAIPISAWRFIVLRSILVTHQIYFKSGMVLAEDQLFSLHVWQYLTKDIPILKNDIYYYRDRPDSAMHNRTVLFNAKNVLNRMHLGSEYLICAEKLRESSNEQMYRILYTRYCQQVWTCLSALPSTDLPYALTMEDMKQKRFFPCPYHTVYFENARGLRKIVQLFKMVVVYRVGFVYKMYYKWFRKKHRMDDKG